MLLFQNLINSRSSLLWMFTGGELLYWLQCFNAGSELVACWHHQQGSSWRYLAHHWIACEFIFYS